MITLVITSMTYLSRPAPAASTKTSSDRLTAEKFVPELKRQ
ncbi:MAG: hypothetical protein ACFFD4_02720 [Candidatus Odinarchaeota archaeon]